MAAFTLAILTIACGCCFLLFLGLTVLAVLVSVLGQGRKRKRHGKVRAKGESDDKGPVVDAEFKDMTGKDI